MTGAARHNDDKPELSQVFWFQLGLNELADVMTQGRKKYPDQENGVPNFMLGGKPDQEYLDAAARHLAKLTAGEELDAECGTHHAAHVVWNMLALMTLNYHGTPGPKAEQRMVEIGSKVRVRRGMAGNVGRVIDVEYDDYLEFKVEFPVGSGPEWSTGWYMDTELELV